MLFLRVVKVNPPVPRYGTCIDTIAYAVKKNLPNSDVMSSGYSIRQRNH